MAPLLVLAFGFFIVGDVDELGDDPYKVGEFFWAYLLSFLALLFSVIRHVYYYAVEHWLFSIFTMVVSVPAACAWFCFLLEAAPGAPCVEGIKTFNDALYFSYVTFTTLGYGELSPNGICRGIAALEAILGILTIGAVPSILIAKKQAAESK